MEADLMLFAHLLTVSPLDGPQRVAEILTRLCGHVTLPEPYYFGEGDPSMVPWNMQTIASVTQQVVQPSKGWYFWRRGAGQESGTISVGRSHLHGVVRTRATGTPQLLEPYIRFF